MIPEMLQLRAQRLRSHTTNVSTLGSWGLLTVETGQAGQAENSINLAKGQVNLKLGMQNLELIKKTYGSLPYK